MDVKPEAGSNGSLEPWLRVEGLSVRYGTTDALRDLSFSIDPGEAAGIFGESGAGKTTLGLALAGLLPSGAACRGRVHLRGRQMRAGTRIAGIHYLSQDAGAGLHPLLRIGRQIRDAARANSGLDADARGLLRRMGFDEPQRIANAYPCELSGGEKRRAALARVLAARPALLILDEPVNGLDPPSQAGILDLLRAGMREGLCLLMISHDPSVLAQLCSRIFVLCDGILVEQGPSAAVFSRRAHPLTAAILKSAPGSGAGRLPVLPDAGARTAEGCPFAPRCPERLDGCLNGLPPLAWLDPEHAVRCRLYG